MYTRYLILRGFSSCTKLFSMTLPTLENNKHCSDIFVCLIASAKTENINSLTFIILFVISRQQQNVISLRKGNTFY
jgi:hypothetical protein